MLVGAETTDLPPNPSVLAGCNAGINTPYKSSFLVTRIAMTMHCTKPGDRGIAKHPFRHLGSYSST